MDIATTLGSISQALTIAKQLSEVSEIYDKAEIRLKIAELRNLLADIKGDLADAKGSIIERDEEIARLKSELSKRDEVKTVRYKGYTFELDAEGKSIGRPYCPVCLQAGQQIQITRATANHDICPKCNAIYSDYPWKLPAGFTG